MNRYDGRYYGFEPHREPPKPSFAKYFAVGVVAGLIGGFASGLLVNRVASPPEPNPPAVAIQTIAPGENKADTPAVYASVAEEVAAKAAPTVVEVSTESKVTHPFFGSYITSGAGSGVILSEDGYIVTNNHVIDGSTTVTVRLSNGSEHFARLIGSDPQTDLAVIKIDGSGLPAAVLADSDSVSVGQPAVAIGNPLGTLGGTVTEGIISAKDREIVIDNDTMQLLQTSAAINPGNSGGGLFNKEGHLVGIVNAKSSGNDIEGLGFAIPANTVKSVVPDLIEHGYVTGRPALGIVPIEVKSREMLYRYRVSDYGVYVESAQSSVPFRPGDRILLIGEQEIAGIVDIKRELARHSVGDTVEVTVERGSRIQTLSVVLLELAPPADNRAGNAA